MDRLASLLEQLDHHRAFLARGVRDVTVEQARARVTPAGPSIAWEVGHCARNLDSMLALVAGAPRLLGEAFDDRGTHPDWGVEDDAAWDALRADAERVGAALARALAGRTDADLDREPATEVHAAFRGTLTTRGALLRGAVFHLAYHLGQIGLLRAAGGLGW